MKVNSRAWKKYLGKIVGKNLTWKIWEEVGEELSDCWHFVTTIISLFRQFLYELLGTKVNSLNRETN